MGRNREQRKKTRRNLSFWTVFSHAVHFVLTKRVVHGSFGFLIVQKSSQWFLPCWVFRVLGLWSRLAVSESFRRFDNGFGFCHAEAVQAESGVVRCGWSGIAIATDPFFVCVADGMFPVDAQVSCSAKKVSDAGELEVVLLGGRWGGEDFCFGGAFLCFLGPGVCRVGAGSFTLLTVPTSCSV